LVVDTLPLVLLPIVIVTGVDRHVELAYLDEQPLGGKLVDGLRELVELRPLEVDVALDAHAVHAQPTTPQPADHFQGLLPLLGVLDAVVVVIELGARAKLVDRLGRQRERHRDVLLAPEGLVPA